MDKHYYVDITVTADIVNEDGVAIDEWQYCTDASVDAASIDEAIREARESHRDEIEEAIDDYEVNNDGVLIDRDTLTYDFRTI